MVKIMGLPQTQQVRFTIEEYLRLEADALEKHEYCDGKILAMAGGSPEHSLVIANVIREIGNQLKGKSCRVYDSNLRIRIPRKTLYIYPDISVICGAIEFDPRDVNRGSILNPQVIVEVLSPSTEAYDRGEKFERYRSLDSMQEYVLVSQITPRIEIFLRHPDGAWLFNAFAGLQAAAAMRSLEISLPLVEVYAGVEFPPAADDTIEK